MNDTLEKPTFYFFIIHIETTVKKE